MTKPGDRERRLAEALRENLRKRKAQTRSVPPQASPEEDDQRDAHSASNHVRTPPST